MAAHTQMESLVHEPTYSQLKKTLFKAQAHKISYFISAKRQSEIRVHGLDSEEDFKKNFKDKWNEEALSKQFPSEIVLEFISYTQAPFYGVEEQGNSEAPTHLLGIDKYGNSMAANPTFKNILTKAVHSTTYFEYDKDTKIISRDISGHIMLPSDKPPLSSSAVMRRFIRWKMQKFERIVKK